MTSPPADRQRGWVSSRVVDDLAAVSREFQDRYGLRVSAFVVLRQSKGGLTQIEAQVLSPSRWWRWFGQRPPQSKTTLTRHG